MPRIPDEDITYLKQEVKIETILADRGISLKKHGKDLITNCPFHNDKTPSFVVSPSKNLWNCLGACGTGGSVIDLVMKLDNLDFLPAVDKLLDGIGMRNKKAKQRRLATSEQNPFREAMSDQQLLEHVLEHYQHCFTSNPQALDYLKSRDLAAPELIEHFGLGYCDNTLIKIIPRPRVQLGQQLREQLFKLGLAQPDGRQQMRGCIVVPLYNIDGQLVSFYGRRASHESRGDYRHNYLSGPLRGIFNYQALKASDEIIICEGIFDAMTFWRHGYRNVTATFGTNGITQELLDGLVKHKVKRVIIAFDRDEAGEKAAEKFARQLKAMDIMPAIAYFPKGMDANEYALKVRPATRSFGLILNLARKDFGDDGGNSSAAAVVVASPIADTPKPEDLSELSFHFHGRHWRIRGLEQNFSYERLKVNVMVRNDVGFFVDTLDIYAAKQRVAFMRQAVQELHCREDMIKSDMSLLLRQLENRQNDLIKTQLAPEEKAEMRLSPADEQAALTLLRRPDLIDKIIADFEACGLVGEKHNTLLGYLAASSRKLHRPLAIVIQSTSAAGKTSLMDAILNLMPGEDVIKYSALTGQSLYYLGEKNLKHKILAVVEEEGAERASYALKLLQSEGELSIASTGKDPKTGEMVTHEYKVEGPVMVMLTTTALDIDEELLNRCLILTINETRQQTRAIHQLQRFNRTLEGRLASQSKDKIIRTHQNAQRLLKPFMVVNPYAQELEFVDHSTRTRRDHEKYLNLIDVIALLHQHQRNIKHVMHEGEIIEYIEVTLRDIELASQLINAVLDTSLDDLPPQTRRVLTEINAFVEQVCCDNQMAQDVFFFSRRDLREVIGLSDTQLKTHLNRLVDLEYLQLIKTEHGRYAYQLLFGQQTVAFRRARKVRDGGGSSAARESVDDDTQGKLFSAQDFPPASDKPASSQQNQSAFSQIGRGWSVSQNPQKASEDNALAEIGRFSSLASKADTSPHAH